MKFFKGSCDKKIPNGAKGFLSSDGNTLYFKTIHNEWGVFNCDLGYQDLGTRVADISLIENSYRTASRVFYSGDQLSIGF